MYPLFFLFTLFLSLSLSFSCSFLLILFLSLSLLPFLWLSIFFFFPLYFVFSLGDVSNGFQTQGPYIHSKQENKTTAFVSFSLFSSSLWLGHFHLLVRFSLALFCLFLFFCLLLFPVDFLLLDRRLLPTSFLLDGLLSVGGDLCCCHLMTGERVRDVPKYFPITFDCLCSTANFSLRVSDGKCSSIFQEGGRRKRILMTLVSREKVEV